MWEVIELSSEEIKKTEVKQKVNPEIKNQIPEIAESKLDIKEQKDILTEDIMGKISYYDFLKHPEHQRLIAITNPRYKSSDLEKNIESWENQEIEFKFSFNWKLNNNLFKKTTAWEVLPWIVREVKNESGEKFVRKWNSGEFFNFKNERLKIYDKTKITILAEASEWYDKQAEEEKISSVISKINKANPEAVKNPILVRKAIEKWVEPNFVLLIFSKIIKSFFWASKDRASLAEDFVTDISRMAWKNRISQDVWENWKMSSKLALLIMQKFSWKDFENDAKDYGIKKEVIEENTYLNWDINIDFKKIAWWDLSKIDFRYLKSKYPREASIKNNNPAGLTWNNTFASTLKNHWISFYKWTSRPSREWWNYFWFENMEEGMNAFNLLWDIKLRKKWNKTFWDFAKNWAVDYSSYRNQFWDIWDKKLSSLDNNYINIIKSKQMKIESPWMHKELSKLWIV